MNLDKLKEVARRHELREEWRKAIDIYHRALEDLAKGGEAADPSLYNRIGDLELKVGDSPAALTAYELAADTYADQGFYNNAIALCGKILRVNPARSATYLRLAELHASKNVLAEARRNLLEFAERTARVGQVQPLVDGIRQFAERYGRSPDMRNLVGEVVAAANAPSDARAALDQLAGELGLAGGSDQVAGPPTRPAIPQAGGWSANGLVFLDTGIDIPIPVMDSARSEEWAAGGEEPPPPPPPVAMEAEAPGTVDALPGIEPTALGAGEPERESAPVTGFEPTVLEAIMALPGPSLLPLVEAAIAEPVEIPGLEPLEEFSVAQVAGDFEIEPIEFDQVLGAIPLLDIGPEELTGPSGPDAEPLFEGLEMDAAMAVTAGAADLSRLSDGELAAVLDRFQEEARWSDALEILAELVRRDPGAIPWYQRRVELAYHAGDRIQLVGAYLALAQVLDRSGARENAALVFRRVIELDPGNPVAAAVLRGPESVVVQEASSPSAQPEASQAGDGFVDLGALILEPEPERDTRMRVEQGEPESEEDVDFRETLEQFMQGIEANLEVTDFQAHYDLGIAFKEMGLLDEAIAQFQKALRAPESRLKSSEALGAAFHEKGRHGIAEAVLSRAVEALPGADDEKIGLIYWLGRAIEAQGRPADALRYYERALAVDITFLDLTDRIHRLTEERVQ